MDGVLQRNRISWILSHIMCFQRSCWRFGNWLHVTVYTELFDQRNPKNLMWASSFKFHKLAPACWYVFNVFYDIKNCRTAPTAVILWPLLRSDKSYLPSKSDGSAQPGVTWFNQRLLQRQDFEVCATWMVLAGVPETSSTPLHDIMMTMK